MSANNVIIGYTYFDGNVRQRFAQSLLDVVTRRHGIISTIISASSPYIPDARNRIVTDFLQMKDEWLWFLDYDMVFDAEVLDALLETADAAERPIVAGLYFNYLPDGELWPLWFEGGGDNEEHRGIAQFLSDEVRELSACGMGCTLIHRSVFEKMQSATKDPWAWFGHDMHRGERLGEDFTFCQRARALGFYIYGTAKAKCGHIKSRIETIDTFIAGFAKAEPIDKAVLNVGGGSKAIPIPPEYAGWKHHVLDIAPGPGVDIVADARDTTATVADGSYEAVYCSHNLEHYYAHEVPGVLAGFLRVLKPLGVLDVRVPDLKPVMREGANGKDLDDVLYVSPAGPIKLRDVIFGFGKEIERSGHPYYAHKTGFTEATLARQLSDAGFSGVVVTASDYELRATAVKR